MEKKSHIELELVQQIASAFLDRKCEIFIEKISSGLINYTYLIRAKSSSYLKEFILQVVNTDNFKNPTDIISNYLILSDRINYSINKFNIEKTSSSIRKFNFCRL